MSSNWTVDDIKDLKGMNIIVTGANSGLGFEASKIYASKNATVILACRSEEKAIDAMNKIKIENSKADLHFIRLDLGDLESIESFVKTYKSKFKKIDILLNNAGIMTVPYDVTKDGFELQNGINHLGHFALTAQLFDLIKSTKDSRIVNVSSIAHKNGSIDFDNYLYEKGGYGKVKSYSRSKLSNLLFTYELARKVEENKIDMKVLVAHPGVSQTELGRTIKKNRVARALISMMSFFSQKASQGTLPLVRASLDENAQSGDYYGPSGFMEMKGKPVKVKSNKKSHNIESAKKLWDISEDYTGIKFNI